MKRLCVSLVTWVYFGIIFLFLFIASLFTFLLTFWSEKKELFQYCIHRAGALLIRYTNPFIRIKADFKFHPLKNGTYIFAANHQSLLDVPILYSIIENHHKWIFKESLLSIPLFGQMAKMAGHISIRRNDESSARICMKTAQKNISNGISVAIFPEGTRSKTGELGPFKTGTARLSQLTGTPIVPITIIGTGQILKKGSWMITPCTINVIINAPIYPTQTDDPDGKQLTDRLHKTILYNLGETLYATKHKNCNF